MSENYGGGASKKYMSSGQLKKLKKSMQASYNKVDQIKEKENQFEGDKELKADELLQQKLNDLDL